MRLLLGPETKKQLFLALKEEHCCGSISELAVKMRIPVKTLSAWFYTKNRYIPERYVPAKIRKLRLAQQSDNWGQIKGGVSSYRSTLARFGRQELQRRQSLGGRIAALRKDSIAADGLVVDITNPLFLRFYGALLGDGWLSNFVSCGKSFWIVGLSCNMKQDREFVKQHRDIVERLFQRKGYIRNRKEFNVAEFVFSHKQLVKYMNEKLGFPIGTKHNQLQISSSVYALGFDKVRYVIQGIFDTDGSFYLAKNKKGIGTSPAISIHMSEPVLIKQIGSMLVNEGFRLVYSDNGTMIKIKGREQLKQWVDTIGSSNAKHLDKIQAFLIKS